MEKYKCNVHKISHFAAHKRECISPITIRDVLEKKI